jgi:hypothetical protein
MVFLMTVAMDLAPVCRYLLDPVALMLMVHSLVLVRLQRNCVQMVLITLVAPLIATQFLVVKKDIIPVVYLYQLLLDPKEELELHKRQVARKERTIRTGKAHAWIFQRVTLVLWLPQELIQLLARLLMQ